MGNITTLTIPAQHPAFEGHFPDAPILPGVVLLDETLHAVQLAARLSEHGWQIATAKFLEPVRPGEALTLRHERLANGSIRFALSSGDRPVASGMLIPSAQADEPDDGHQAG
ncbi:MAG: beta-hydroxyacyl-ACP dehydratase [Gammaproteobacteria bacterium]|jgi:3-hydroxyacyl-[acyl-carrier-protein] dehydratase|nr:beta-hydroxyacyl-ACP dehydratase [Gammaproteobacteria bacterium]